MNPQIKKHFVAIVHYGNPTLTVKSVNSVLQADNPPDALIVINHSHDTLSLPTDSRLHQINPQVNSGYAAGINMALGVIITLGAKSSDVVTCLNNDVVILVDTFTKLRQWWLVNPGNALLGLAVREQRAVQKSGYVNLFTGRCHLTESALPQRYHWYSFTLPYVHGAGFSAPLDLLLHNHGLPTKYFMYWEDVSFSHHVRLRNLPLITAPDIIINHNESSPDASLSPHKIYYLVRNGAMFLASETPRFWRGYWWLGNRLRYIYHHLRGHQPVVTKALRDALKQTTGPIISSSS